MLLLLLQLQLLVLLYCKRFFCYVEVVGVVFAVAATIVAVFVVGVAAAAIVVEVILFC